MIAVESGFDSRREQNIVLFTISRPAVGPPNPTIKWTPRAIFTEIKRERREADNSRTSSAEIKNGCCWSDVDFWEDFRDGHSDTATSGAQAHEHRKAQCHVS